MMNTQAYQLKFKHNLMTILQLVILHFHTMFLIIVHPCQTRVESMFQCYMNENKVVRASSTSSRRLKCLSQILQLDKKS